MPDNAEQEKEDSKKDAPTRRPSLRGRSSKRRSSRVSKPSSNASRRQDAPGIYRIVIKGGIDPRAVRGGTGKDDFANGQCVRISEVYFEPDGVTMGQVEGTETWVPLVNNQTGLVFANRISIKEMVKAKLNKPVYDVHDLYWETGLWQHIAKHPVFENFTLVVITLNAGWISYDADKNQAESLLDAKYQFQIAEQMFCVYFSFEWYVRFMSFKSKLKGFQDYWFLFDSSLVFFMVLETWIMSIYIVTVGASFSAGGGQASLLRLLRLLRLSRLARMLRSMPELMILIKGIAAASRTVLVTISLLVILMYIFAIIFRLLTAESAVAAAYFQSIPSSMYILLMYGTFLEDLGQFVDMLGRESYVFAFIFMVFVLLSALTVLNMLIGILCEVVSDVAQAEKEDMLVEFVHNKLEEIMGQMEENEDFRVSKEEFKTIMYKPEAVNILQVTGVDAVGLADYVDFIFEDDEGKERTLTVEEFMDTIFLFRNSKVATVKDVVDLRKFVGSAFKRLDDRVSRKLKKHGFPPNFGAATAFVTDGPVENPLESMSSSRLIPQFSLASLRTASSGLRPYPSRPIEVNEVCEKNADSEAATEAKLEVWRQACNAGFAKILPNLRRLDAFMSSMAADFGALDADLAVTLTAESIEPAGNKKRSDGSEAPMVPIPGVPEESCCWENSPGSVSLWSPAAFGSAERLRRHADRLDCVASMCMQELEQVDIGLPLVAFHLVDVGARADRLQSRCTSVRLWRAQTEELFLTTAEPMLQRLAAADTSHEGHLKFETSLCDLAADLTRKRDEVRLLCELLADDVRVATEPIMS